MKYLKTYFKPSQFIYSFTIVQLIISINIVNTLKAQDFKYRRSSLARILIESEDFPNKNAVNNSWVNYPFPDKYNKHDIPTKKINIESILLGDQDLLNAGFLKDTLKNPLQIAKAETLIKPLRYLNNEHTEAVILPNEKEEYQIKIDKVIREQHLARQLIASWFNRGQDGKLDMSLIQERGFYNATELEAGIAKGQARGLASLGDAGEELIRNTFVTFTKLNFVANEPVARAVRDAAKLEIMKSAGNKPQILIDKALTAADNVYEKTKEGYSLWSKTWLYRLNWNDSIAAIFYSDLWSNPTAFDTTNMFSIEFVGVQYNQSLVTFKLGEKRTEEQIIDLSLVRNIDNAFSELQKKNDVFKPKAPVLTAEPITAQIGMKEGLEGGEKFDVLEMRLNEKSGRTEYIKVAEATVDKKFVWDNRYNAGEKAEVEVLDANGNPLVATVFKGGSKIQPGMLLKQSK